LPWSSWIGAFSEDPGALHTLPYTGRRVVERVITDLAVFNVCDGPWLREVAPGVTIDVVRSVTGAPFSVAGDLTEMRLPRSNILTF